MKNYTLFLWIALLMLGISGTIGAREVASFNDGWEFKKGPFSKEALQAVQKWNSDWQEVSIPHTWNADDMQKQASAFYEGVGDEPAHIREAKLWIKSIREDTEPFVKPEEAYVVTQILEGIYESAKTGKPYYFN